MKNSFYTLLGKKLIHKEIKSLQTLEQNLDHNFELSCEAIYDTQGKVIITGIGKSGHIGQKIAATLASTGTPAFFMHLAEASHGDLGMIEAKDIVIIVSNSGESNEILNIIPVIKRRKIKMIALTSNSKSSLAQNADIILNIHSDKEACPLGLAPTSSTTNTLVLGDALAVALLEKRGFKKDEFALHHPGGSLGRRLLLKVEQVMRIKDSLPLVFLDQKLDQVLIEMTSKALGIVAVLNQKNEVCGVFTDGDLRRALNAQSNLNVSIQTYMTREFTYVTKDTLAATALEIMQTNKINALIVLENKKLIGAFNIHDLLVQGVY